MIIETPIGKDKIFKIDTDKLEYDKKGKIVNCSEIKLPRSVKNDPEMLEHYKKWYSLVEINGRFLRQNNACRSFARHQGNGHCLVPNPQNRQVINSHARGFLVVPCETMRIFA